MPDPTTLQTRTWLDIHRALFSLDAVKECGEVLALEYSTPVRLAILRNAELVGRELVAYFKFERELSEKYQVVDGMPVTAENAPKLVAYRADIETAKDAELEIGVTKIKLDGLLSRPDGKKNKTPQSLLNRLAPILED